MILAAFETAHARASDMTITKEATGVSEVRFARVRDGKTTPTATAPKENV